VKEKGLIRKKYSPWLFIAPTIVILISLGVFPLIYSVWLSLHSYSLIDLARGIKWVGGRNFLDLLQKTGSLRISFVHAFLLTLVYMGGCLGLELAIGLGGALAFARKADKKVRIQRTLAMVPMLIAPVVVGNIWKYMYQYSYGFANFLLRSGGLPTPRWLSEGSWAMVSLILADAWEWCPFSFLVLLASILSIPKVQLEAADIDGATQWQKFLYIVLPGIKKSLLLIILIRGIELIKTMDLVYTLTYGGPATATSILPFNAFFLGFKYFEIGKAAAYAWLLVAFTNIFVIFFVSVLREPRS